VADRPEDRVPDGRERLWLPILDDGVVLRVTPPAT
jgi:hypothetical protein